MQLAKLVDITASLVQWYNRVAVMFKPARFAEECIGIIDFSKEFY